MRQAWPCVGCIEPLRHGSQKPLILHLTTTEEASVLQAIDQAIGGFEIVNFSLAVV